MDKKIFTRMIAFMLLVLSTASIGASNVENNFSLSSVEPEEKVFAAVEKAPQFPEGEAAMMKFIKESIQYPADAAEEHIEGRVTVKFVVEKDGSISNPTIVRGRTESLDKEALRIISSMPKWTPGIRGKSSEVLLYHLHKLQIARMIN